MPIPYVGFSVQMHGLALKNLEDVEALRLRVLHALEEIHPGGRIANDGRPLRLEGDVEVEVDEHAGEPFPHRLPSANVLRTIRFDKPLTISNGDSLELTERTTSDKVEVTLNGAPVAFSVETHEA